MVPDLAVEVMVEAVLVTLVGRTALLTMGEQMEHYLMLEVVLGVLGSIMEVQRVTQLRMELQPQMVQEDYQGTHQTVVD